MFWLVYLLHVRPYKDKICFYADLFNEYVFWVMTYFMPIFSSGYDVSASNLKLIGAIFLSLLAILIVVNIVFAVIMAIKMKKSATL